MSLASFVVQVSRCRTSHSAMCFLPAQVLIWNDFPIYTLFDTGTLVGLRVQSTVGCLPQLCLAPVLVVL